MGLWKWLTTPSKPKQIKRRADEILPKLMNEVNQMKSGDGGDKLSQATDIFGRATQLLMDEFGLTRDEAYAAVREAMQRAQMKQLFG